VDREQLTRYRRQGKAVLLVPLGEVPNEGIVVKRSGAAEHRVCRAVTVYQDGQKQEILASDGCVFLHPLERPGAAFNAYPPDTPVLWVAPAEDIAAHLYEEEGDK